MTTTREPTTADWQPFAAAAWLVLFLAVYFSQPLPNNGNIIRWELWPVLPFAVMDAVDPPVEPGSPPRGWGYLGQRLPLMLTASVIAVAAWAVGRTLLAAVPCPDLTPGERFYFCCLIGLGGVSLITLGLGLAGVLSRWSLLGSFVVVSIAGMRSPSVGVQPSGCAFPEKTKSSLKAELQRDWWLIAAVAPFLIGMLFGSLSPSTDFDVNEYHLGGPKEWFLAGRITFLDHNVYTSFPFLTEMLLLAGMVIHGDWFTGALAGQMVLMLFAPLTAFGLHCLGCRWWSPLAGRLGALIYLTTPWVFRMSIIAYAEGGLTAYTGGTVIAGLLALTTLRNSSGWSPILLCGLCAGGAMACKYTGLVMAVAPWAVMFAVAAFLCGSWRSVLTTLVVYFAGVVMMVGPWLAKNLVETGNPVYPLGYRVFGGRDLDDTLAEKWRRGHARPSAGSVVGEIRDLGGKAFDVATINDWTSPLVFAFAPLAVLAIGNRREMWFLAGITIWLFLCWWLFTHHLDRFWLPLLPSACALAGIGAASVCHGRVGRASENTPGSARPADTAVAHKRSVPAYVAVAALLVGWVYNLGFCSTGLVGYNAGLTDLNYARDFTAKITGPEIAWLNAAIDDGTLPADTKVLCVGEAELFHAQFPYVYNTVFDRSIFEDWCGEPGDTPSKDRPLRSAEEIRQTFATHGITHILVNWTEIVRYRQTYGYTDFVHPARFAALRQLGVIGEPLQLPDKMGVRGFMTLSAGEQHLFEQWAPELIIPCGDGRCVVTGQVFPVTTE